MEELVAKLVRVQSNLVAKKDQKNNFGGYQYRTAEGILAAVKPLLAEEGLFIMLADEIEVRGEGEKERFYLKSTAMVTDGKNQMSCSAYARESFSKKGQDDAMITGSASSYARKYCLNGMFGIDDSKQDPDRGHTKMFQAIDKKFEACKTKAEAEAQLKKCLAAKIDKAVKDYAQEVFDKFEEK